MKHLSHNLGKLVAIVAVAVIAIAVLVVAAKVAPASAAPVPQSATATTVPTVAASKATTATTAITGTKGAAAVEPTKVPAPVAVLRIVPIPANPKTAYPITATIKYMTDTAAGQQKAVVALASSGLTNEPVGVPIRLTSFAADPTATVTKTTWTLTPPSASKVKLTTDAAKAKDISFTPDVPGIYKVDVVLANAGGTSQMASVQIHAGTYVGVDAGNCKQCHPEETAEWAKTGHNTILSDNIDNKRTPDVATHYAETCIRCHTTGYYPGVSNGGYGDVAAKANYEIPTFKQIDAAGKGGASNFAAMPAAVKAMANIQCEDCHGPAKEHITSGTLVMSSTQAEGVCNQCHNGGGHHLKGTDLQNAAHSDATAAAWTEPTGPDHQQCVRCHSGNGYVSFLKDPTDMASWDNTMQTVVCSTCHDPHSEKNTWQLRITGKPVQVTFDAKDQGLSATCVECHNARTKPADAVNGSFPHYASDAEFLNNTGGVDYGKKIPDSPHGTMVGAAPIPNPAAKDDPEAAKFLFSAAGDEKGNTPGSCVSCHMYPTIENAKDANYHKVGSHSFNMVSPDGKFDYTAACTSCHAGIKDFNVPAKADYDGNGKVEGAQDEVKGLLNVLWQALEAKGLKKVDSGYPYATLPKMADGKVDPKISNAWYNYRTVYGVMWGENGAGNEGKSQAIHNFNRAVSLLQLSYNDLTGKDVPGATILVK